MAASKNITVRKKSYRNALLEIIRTEPYASRSMLKSKSGLSMETVLQTVDGMLQDGLIYESGFGGAPVGRKATWLSINPGGRYFIGVKFSALKLCGVLLNFAGTAVCSREYALEETVTAAELIPQIFACIQELLDTLGDKRDRVCGIGIGAPGVLDPKAGIFIRYANIPTLSSIPIRRMVEAEFGIPTLLEHSLKVTMTAHRMDPENRDLRNALFVLVKGGVGMSLLLDGRLYYGVNNSAGEIGHIKVTENGRRCHCGKHGCLESEIGYKAITSAMRQGLAENRFPVLARMLEGRQPQINDFVAAAQSGDPDALALFDRVCTLLGGVMTCAVTMFNPQKIIFSGEVTSIAGFLDRMRRDIAERCPLEAVNALSLTALNTDDLFDAAGAAYLIMSDEFGVSVLLPPE
ncbi:MAG TPA: ROK family protein [Clostridia bacterium]|nr:ROK family protein [Clostridia bacterium]